MLLLNHFFVKGANAVFVIVLSKAFVYAPSTENKLLQIFLHNCLFAEFNILRKK